MESKFLPITKEEMQALGWDAPDFVYVTGDAYVDHPSFGAAIISRVLENAGYRVCMLPQPDWHSKDAFMKFGKPRLGFLISAGVVDSMVNNYTAAKKKRNDDVYSPGGKSGYRPDRATIVYANRIREAYNDTVIAIGGVEASLRRFAHYDYWDNRVRNSILLDSCADILMFGMGEKTIIKVAEYLKKDLPIVKMRIPGTCVMVKEKPEDALEVNSAEDVSKDKSLYSQAFMVQYTNQDPIRGKAIIQKHGARYLLQNIPAMPLTTQELDAVYALPYTRTWHPIYDSQGGIPALKEVEFSITSERGCFGSCSFCAITFHQGRIVTARSKESILKEAALLTKQKNFKGYIHDVGGPTANFGHPSCDKQLKCGTCKNRQCLFPSPCPNLNTDHSQYVQTLKELRTMPGIKKVFIRSGIRFDYMLLDKSNSFMEELVQYHISGQLKVAPEHISPKVLKLMGKPDIGVFDEFRKKYENLNKKYNKEQYIVPYFISSHPGCTLNDAIKLSEYMRQNRLHPDQVQDFYPTPGTLSTCMYYTETDPATGKKIYVAKKPEDKAEQRALMQYNHPENKALVLRALLKAGRQDLIGTRPGCLVDDFKYTENNRNQKLKGQNNKNEHRSKKRR